MTYSPGLSSGFAQTGIKSKYVSPQSGMCSLCADTCNASCEIAQAAVLGAQTVYPTTTGANQIASEKDYPIDYSHFNINGRVFGAVGVPDGKEATIYNVDLSRSYGTENPVKLAMPVVLPALIKLNWQDYFSGAAMAGVTCMVGEGAMGKDGNLVIKNGKVTEFPMLNEIKGAFQKYYRGYGQIALQCNIEDFMMGIPEMALGKYGFDAIEIKFGQGAKGTQPAIRVKSLEEAKSKKIQGFDVFPDPDDPKVAEAYAKNLCGVFYTYNRLPMWTEEELAKKVSELRQMGAKNLYFKMASYDSKDMEQVLRWAGKMKIDMVTFDGSGGGSGYSPSKMMNEWGLPTVCMEDVLVRIAQKLEKEGCIIPAINITGGFASEDQVFKGLAYGDNYVTSIGLCRASMAAAMRGKEVGHRIKSGDVPKEYAKYGTTVEEIFADLPDLRSLYGISANDFPTGAIGVFSYLNKIAFGLKHFAALNRKFNVNLLSKEDLLPLTADAKGLVSGKWFEE